MKTPRSVSATGLIKKLKPLGYEVTRQSGSHIRLTTEQKGRHHITVPNHDPLRVGTFSSIITDIAKHFGKSKKQLLDELF